MDFAVVSILYDQHPLAAEGELTSLKMKATNNLRLGEIGIRIGLYKMLLHANPVFTETYQRYENIVRMELYGMECHHSLSAMSSSTIGPDSSSVAIVTASGSLGIGNGSIDNRKGFANGESVERGMFTGEFSSWATTELGLGIIEEEDDDDEEEFNEGKYHITTNTLSETLTIPLFSPLPISHSPCLFSHALFIITYLPNSSKSHHHHHQHHHHHHHHHYH